MVETHQIKRISLVVPNLFAVSGTQLEKSELNQLIEINRFVGRSQVDDSSASRVDLFAQLLSLNPFPAAAFCRLGAGASKDERFWLSLDPVHFEAHNEDIVLRLVREMDDRYLAALAENCRPLFDEPGSVYEQRGGRWFLGFEHDPGIQTTPLEAVVGQSIKSCLPQGERAAFWQRLFTEIQMALFAAQSQIPHTPSIPPVNGVWMWGEGQLPKQSLTTPWDYSVGDDALLRGITHFGGSTHLEAIEHFQSIPQDVVGRGHLMIYCSNFQTLSDSDVDTWLAMLRGFENHWLSPAMDCLRHRIVDEIRLYSCDGRVFRGTRQRLSHLWRRQGLYNFLR